ncbi:hypothetical protein Tco_1037989 [Tanacetum coccineum]
MVAYLKKPEGSEGFHQIVDFLNASHISNMKRASKGYTGENIPLFPAINVQGPVVQGEGSTHPPKSPTQTPIADVAASTGVDVRYGGATTTVTSLEAGQGCGNINKTPTMPHDSPLPRVNTLGSDEGSMTQQELMVFCITLSKKVESLQIDLKQTKQIYGTAYTKLIKKVKKLEKTVKSNQTRRRARIVVSDDEDDLEDPSKQGRKIAEIDQDLGISLEVSTTEKDVSTAEPVSTTGAAVTTASVAVSTASPTRNTRVSTADDITMAETLVFIRKSAAKDKGKGKMAESETVQTKTKLQQEQERLDFEAAMRLQVELEEEERQRIAMVHEAASSFNVEEWEDIQARIEADEELVQRLQAKEREKYTEAEQERMLAELSPIRNTRVSTADDITMAKTLVYIRKIATKDKGKGKMDESETVQTKTKLQQEQKRLDFEAVVRLQAELGEEERQRISKVHEAARSLNVKEWEVLGIIDLMRQKNKRMKQKDPNLH